MQIRKTYKDINPELMYDELRDIVLKQGLALKDSGLGAYSLPGGSTHTVRAILKFNPVDENKQCLQAHIIGTTPGETKLVIDYEETLISPEKVHAIEDDMAFIFGSYEV